MPIMATSDMDTLPLLMLSETPQWHITMPVGRGHPRHQQRRRTMGMKRTEEFRKDAVRIALTSRLPRKQVADDLGVGMSTLNIEHVLRRWFERACERSHHTETLTWFRKRI
jgi:hypothetical protein